jgi:tripartite ATP-independent transporter DctP family solute receptor
MRRNGAWGLIVLVGVLIALVGCAKKPDGSFKKEYRMQVNVGPQSYWGMGAARFADLVREKTGGRIHIKPYFGSQLLKGAQLHSAQMVSSGAIDLAFESTINTAPVIPEMNVFSLPFFINTYENLDRMTHGETGRLIFEAMKKKDLMPLAWGENGFRQLTNNKRVVRRPEDLKGLKIRVVGPEIFIDIFRSLGADPINMNWGDAVTAFQQKTVDGQENPVSILTSVQIFQFQSHLTLWNYIVDPLILYWCKKEWDAFPADIQSAILEAAQEAGRFEKALCRAGLDGDVSLNILKRDFNYDIPIMDPVRYLEEKGMQVTRLTDVEIAAFKTVTAPVSQAWINRISQPVYQAALNDMGVK